MKLSLRAYVLPIALPAVVASCCVMNSQAQNVTEIGGQKIVPDVATGLRRIAEYCFPLEDRRAREAYGVPSGVNNVLIINRAIAPGRVSAIVVRQSLGF